MKAKQLCSKTSQVPGTGPTTTAKAQKTIKELTSTLAEACSVISELSDMSSKLSKKDMEIDIPKDDYGWGRDHNRDNPALARQDGPLKKSRQN